jgi:hypothetical protein
MSQQQLLLKEKLSISQILRVYGKQFMQITGRYSDGDKNLIIQLNDSDATFDEIADYLR